MDNLLVKDLDTELVCYRENVEINIDIMIDHSYIYMHTNVHLYMNIYTRIYICIHETNRSFYTCLAPIYVLGKAT